MSGTLWDNLGNDIGSSLSTEAAQSKRPALAQQPSQQPMKANIKPADQKRPSADQKRVRRQMTRQAAFSGMPSIWAPGEPVNVWGREYHSPEEMANRLQVINDDIGWHGLSDERVSEGQALQQVLDELSRQPVAASHKTADRTVYCPECGGPLVGSYEEVTCDRCGRDYAPLNDGYTVLGLEGDEVFRIGTGGVLKAVEYAMPSGPAMASKTANLGTPEKCAFCDKPPTVWSQWRDSTGLHVIATNYYCDDHEHARFNWAGQQEGGSMSHPPTTSSKQAATGDTDTCNRCGKKILKGETWWHHVDDGTTKCGDLPIVPSTKNKSTSIATKESSTMTAQSHQPTEADLVARLAAATSMSEQTTIAAELENLRSRHRESLAQRDTIDWDAMGALPLTREQQMLAHLSAAEDIGDSLPHTASIRATEASDWLDEVVPTHTEDHVMGANVRAQATRWFTEEVWAPVKADPSEFSSQAKNAAVRAGTFYGLQYAAARSVFLDQVRHLASREGIDVTALEETVETYVSDGRDSLPVGVSPTDASAQQSLDEWGLGHDNNASADPKSDTERGNAPSLSEGTSPDGDKGEGVENPLTNQQGLDHSTFDSGSTEDKMLTQQSSKTAGEYGGGSPKSGDTAKCHKDGGAIQFFDGQWMHLKGTGSDHNDVYPATPREQAEKDKTSSMASMFASFVRDGGDGIATYSGVEHLAEDPKSTGVDSAPGGIQEGTTPEGDHAESPVQEPGQGAEDKSSGGNDPDSIGTGGTGSDATSGPVPGSPPYATSSLIPLPRIAAVFRGRQISESTRAFAAGLEQCASLEHEVGGVSARVMVTHLLAAPEVPPNVKQALAAHLHTAGEVPEAFKEHQKSKGDDSGSSGSGGQTCAVCGDKIAQDPNGEDPSTWHHDNGEKHDHEAKPSGGESKEGRRAPFSREAAEGEVMPPGSVRITSRPDKSNRVDVVQVFGPTTSIIQWQGYDEAEARMQAQRFVDEAKSKFPGQFDDAKVYDSTKITGSKTASEWGDAHPGKERCPKTEQVRGGDLASQRYSRCVLEKGHEGEHEYGDKTGPAPTASKTAAGGQGDYDEGYALGQKHKSGGQDYRLPFGKHVDFVSGYKDGYYDQPKSGPRKESARRTAADDGDYLGKNDGRWVNREAIGPDDWKDASAKDPQGNTKPGYYWIDYKIGARKISATLKVGGISLSNVGIVDADAGICKGTDPSGKEVRFKASPSEISQLKAVLYSDLAGNFSGVEIEESDIVKGALRQAAAEGWWPRTRDSESFPGEKTLACPNCGGPVVMEGYHGPGGRLGDPGGGTTLRCQNCGYSQSFPHEASVKTATWYCTTHQVYVGDGNRDTHSRDSCNVVQRKKKDSALAVFASLVQAGIGGVVPFVREGATRCPGSGQPMKNQGTRSTDAKFFGYALGDCPSCGKKVRSKTNRTPQHNAEEETGSTKTAGWIDSARKVVDNKGFVSIDHETGHEVETEWLGDEISPDAKGVVLDMTTANMLVTVHDALNETNAAKFAALPLLKAVDMGWSLAARARA